MNGIQHIFDDVSALNEAVARQWQLISTAAIKKNGVFRVALAGGSTPRKLYERLAQPDYRDQLAWDKTHIYFGDERCVPQDHADSNYHMASEVLLSKVPIPLENIHAMYTPVSGTKVSGFKVSSPDENAEQYAALVDEFTTFDLVLLGMGDDGHTASLFPQTGILDEVQKTVAAQFVEKLSVWRISLTFPVINAATHVAILVAGEGKAEILASVASSGSSMQTYPIQRVNPQGKLDWYLDRAAARLLPADVAGRKM